MKPNFAPIAVPGGWFHARQEMFRWRRLRQPDRWSRPRSCLPRQCGRFARRLRSCRSACPVPPRFPRPQYRDFSQNRQPFLRQRNPWLPSRAALLMTPRDTRRRHRSNLKLSKAILAGKRRHRHPPTLILRVSYIGMTSDRTLALRGNECARSRRLWRAPQKSRTRQFLLPIPATRRT